MQYWRASENYKWYFDFDLMKVKEQQFCMVTVATICAVISVSIGKANLKIPNNITAD